jgi:hypothetical protein
VAISIGLLLAAVGIGLVTLLTPRGYDDWFYLAYIKDFVSGHPLGAEDAIFNMGAPASARIWFGGGWWVVESLISEISGADPVTCHQVYFPLLLVPFSVFALFTLGKRIFRSTRTALLACCCQVVFYLSSAFPYKSAGWVFFCRIAQDKAVACLVIAPVVAALGFRLIDRRDWVDSSSQGAYYVLYWWLVVTSVLVHGMGPVWCGLIIFPFAVSELLRHRDRISARKLLLVALPLIVCGLLLVSVQGVVKDVIRGPEPEAVPVTNLLSSIYLPGETFGSPIETWSPITRVLDTRLIMLHPLFVVRYPLAIVGLLLTILLIPRLRSSTGARFLFGTTLLVLLLAFTPVGAEFTSRLMTRRMIFRLTWVLPWGFTLAYFLRRLKPRPAAAWLAVLAISLALARGNPSSYVDSPLAMRSRNRPGPDAEAAFAYLSAQPSPQGVVLASEKTGRMIPAYVPDAHLVNFREFGPVDREDLKALLSRPYINYAFVDFVGENRVRYIMLEKDLRLAMALARGKEFAIEYENSTYGIWRVPRETEMREE